MGLLIFDRQADIGFCFYLLSLHRVKGTDVLHLQSDERPETQHPSTDGQAVFLITSEPLRLCGCQVVFAFTSVTQQRW